MTITIGVSPKNRKDYAQAKADAATFAKYTEADLLKAVAKGIDLAHPETLKPLFADVSCIVREEEDGKVSRFLVILFAESTVTNKLTQLVYICDASLRLCGESVSITDYRKCATRAFNIPR